MKKAFSLIFLALFISSSVYGEPCTCCSKEESFQNVAESKMPCHPPSLDSQEKERAISTCVVTCCYKSQPAFSMEFFFPASLEEGFHKEVSSFSRSSLAFLFPSVFKKKWRKPFFEKPFQRIYLFLRVLLI